MSTPDHNTQNEALWQAWQNLQSSAEDALQKGASHYFKCIRQSICDKLAMDALTAARLGQNDERIYDHLVYLMETYQEVICLFQNQIEGASPDLVAGLCEILASRLNQFDDVAAGQGNPVAKEKHAILEKAIIHTTQQLENIEASYDPPADLYKEILAGNTDMAWQSLRDSIIRDTFPSIYTHYQENLHRCLSSIDDLHTRKTASYYTDLLEREWEVLGLIVRVQVQALETAFDCHQSNTPADEYNAIESADIDDGYSLQYILSKLREAYQQTGLVVSNLQRTLQSAINTPHATPDLTCDIFTQAILMGLAAPSAAMIDSHAFESTLLPEADNLFEGLRVDHFEMVQNLQFSIVNESTLAEEVTTAFENAMHALVALDDASCVLPTIQAETSGTEPETISDVSTKLESEVLLDVSTGLGLTALPDEPSEPEFEATKDTSSASDSISNPTESNLEKEILSGISETLDIKVESLKESLQTFSESNTQLLAALSSEIPILTESDLTNAADHLKQAWYANPPTPETVPDFLAECINLPPFTTHSDEFAKLIAVYTSKAEKASTRFKKEALLYEVSTYEEILYYSVSRLRESNAPQVESAVRILDETFQSIENLLTESGIAVIRPAPHDPFNGREHEVLAAEEQEGFAKGEIIKVMTSGYKHLDQVILRANVIAAR